MIFSDLNIDVDNTNYDVITDELAIANALEAIWETPKKSRVFRRQFGSNLGNLLFEPMNRLTELRIVSEMKTQVEMWENRVTDFSLQVVADYSSQSYYCEGSYKIPALNNKQVNFNFNLRI